MDRKTYNKEYYQKNKEKFNKPGYNKEYQNKNKDKIKNYQKTYRENNIDYWQEYYKNNKHNKKERDKKYFNNKYKNDLLFKLKYTLGKSIRVALKDKGYVKNKRMMTILGCSITEFKTHIESKWEPWMSWDNYGLYNGELNYGWDIDHIIPKSIAETEEGLYILYHYTNLQPLCSKINRDIKKDILNFKHKQEVQKRIPLFFCPECTANFGQ